MKKLLVMAVAAVLILSAASCGKKNADDEAFQKAKDFEISNVSAPKYIAPEPIPLPVDQKVEVPKEVKAKYRTVTMLVGDRKTKEVRKFKVKIGETVAVPGTDYTIKVDSYLPHWVLRGKTVTSLDDGPKDPAVRAVIYEKGKTEPAFDGYIFEKHGTPSFNTDKVAIGLGGAEK